MVPYRILAGIKYGNYSKALGELYAILKWALGSLLCICQQEMHFVPYPCPLLWTDFTFHLVDDVICVPRNVLWCREWPHTGVDGMYSPPFSSVSPSPYLCWESGVTAGNWSKGEQEIQFCKKILNLPTHYFKKYFNHDQNIPENEVNTCIS